MVLNSPLLWALASIALGTAILVRHPMIVAFVTATCFAWLICLSFRLKPSKVERTILKDWIRTSNARQDRELASYAGRLHDAGHADHAGTVIDFLAKKRHIEALLAKSDATNPSRIEVENLVDRICLAIPRQMEQLLETEQRLEEARKAPSSLTGSGRIDAETRQALEQSRTASLDRIERARELLARTLDDMETVIDPAAESRRLEEGEDLEQSIERLEQELEIAERTRTRILEDSRPATPSTPDTTAPGEEPANGSGEHPPENRSRPGVEA